MQFDGFLGKLTSGKWAKIGKCSTDTALNDIRYLMEKGVLRKNDEEGRSTNYSLVTELLFTLHLLYALHRHRAPGRDEIHQLTSMNTQTAWSLTTLAISTEKPGQKISPPRQTIETRLSPVS